MRFHYSLFVLASSNVAANPLIDYQDLTTLHEASPSDPGKYNALGIESSLADSGNPDWTELLNNESNLNNASADVPNSNQVLSISDPDLELDNTHSGEPFLTSLWVDENDTGEHTGEYSDGEKAGDGTNEFRVDKGQRDIDFIRSGCDAYTIPFCCLGREELPTLVRTCFSCTQPQAQREAVTCPEKFRYVIRYKLRLLILR
jgi:hypothetical protein